MINVKIDLNNGGHGTVNIGGSDIAGGLLALRYEAIATGTAPRLTLELVPRITTIEGVVRCHFPASQVDVLRRFGWTPPANAAGDGHGGIIMDELTD